MASMLDKSLDDIIKESKSSGGRGRGGGRGGKNKNAGRAVGRGDGSKGGRGGRGVGRDSRKDFVRSRPISKPARSGPKQGMNPRSFRMTVQNDMWSHDMYEVAPSRIAPPRGNIETGTKLMITNLHFNVSDEDVKELFEELGDVKRSKVLFDRSGRSEGKAEVVYTRKADALAAVKRYNGVRLDGQPMHIELAKSWADGGEGGLHSRGGREGGFGGGFGGRQSNQGYGNFSRLQQPARPARGGRGGRGVGRSNGRREQGSSRSTADLDADLDSYQGMEE
mmetsp:Transcript_16825/g.23244  ORF Transcript_16825/g.23244 Transcript_16825/m.23244 type:complete len:279 (+) Transcript_16825:131-967(+)